jgi:hypothetical protein
MRLVLILAMEVIYGIGSYIEGTVVTFMILLNIGESLFYFRRLAAVQLSPLRHRSSVYNQESS